MTIQDKKLLTCWTTERMVRFIDAHIRKHNGKYKSRNDLMLQSLVNQISRDLHEEHVLSQICDIERSLKILSGKKHSIFAKNVEVKK
jgi:Arc/MetJ-type ribon-helix-helix transcriptional regulator